MSGPWSSEASLKSRKVASHSLAKITLVPLEGTPSMKSGDGHEVVAAVNVKHSYQTNIKLST